MHNNYVRHQNPIILMKKNQYAHYFISVVKKKEKERNYEKENFSCYDYIQWSKISDGAIRILEKPNDEN